MASIADTIHTQGFASLLSIHGQVVTFDDGVSATVLINRIGNGYSYPGAPIKADTGEESTLMVPSSIAERTPGMVATEANGTKHRLGIVRNLGYAWECSCEVTR